MHMPWPIYREREGRHEPEPHRMGCGQSSLESTYRGPKVTEIHEISSGEMQQTMPGRDTMMTTISVVLTQSQLAMRLGIPIALAPIQWDWLAACTQCHRLCDYGSVSSECECVCVCVVQCVSQYCDNFCFGRTRTRL